MHSLYLKCLYEDGVVYCKISPIEEPEDEYVFRGVELAQDRGRWESDTFELTDEELEEMYEDGFQEVERKEFEEAMNEYRGHKPAD